MTHNFIRSTIILYELKMQPLIFVYILSVWKCSQPEMVWFMDHSRDFYPPNCNGNSFLQIHLKFCTSLFSPLKFSTDKYSDNTNNAMS